MNGLLRGLTAFVAVPLLFVATPALAKTTAPVRIFKLSGPVAEVKNPWDVFGLDNILVFPRLIEAIDTHAADPLAKTLVFKVRSPALGFAQATELAEAVARAKAKGKSVIVHAETLSGMAVMGLLGASRVNLAPEGTLVMAGLRAEAMFYKDLLDKLGLSADIEAMGKYKSAAEPMTRNSMSAEAREALEALIDDLYGEVVAHVAKGRRMKVDKVKALIDQGLFHAEEARKAGLVDSNTTWEALYADLEKKSGKKKPPVLVYPRAEKLPDVSSIFSLLSLLTKKPDKEALKGNKIAVLSLEGPIVMGSAGADPFATDNQIASRDVIRTLRTIRDDRMIKALVVRINSPGGSALASDVIWQELATLKKRFPVIVSMGNYAASGGYYIASAGHAIVAEPSTITGSIGVFGGKLVMGGMMKKIGVNTVVVQRGKNAGLFSSSQRFSDSERTVLRGHMKRTYDTFVNRVARGRSMSYDAVHKVAQGRVWSGADAKSAGLVDALGGLGTAMQLAAKKAKVNLAKTDVEHYPRQRSVMEMLESDRFELSVGNFWDRLIGSALDRWLGNKVAPLAEGLLGQVKLVHQLVADEVVVAMMPFALRIE